MPAPIWRHAAHGTKARKEVLDPGFMATARTFGQQFLFTRCWSSRRRPGTPRSRRVGRALLGAAAPATARLPKKLGVVNLGNDVGGDEPEVASK